LIVDDVYTTGSSVKAAISLIKKYNPKEIRVLTVAKNIEKLSYKKQINESG
jgi:predicted amidophosphoribosyltransferase